MKHLATFASFLFLTIPLAAQPRGAAAGSAFCRDSGSCCPVSDPITEVGPRLLTEADRDALRFMWEEEKLARDTYLFFSELWGLHSFQQIGGRSEPRHMEAVGLLMDRYAVAQPASGDRPGEFVDPQFTSLYAVMTARGEQSLAEALRVAISIEELDIRDLTDRIEATDNTDLRRVFGKLRAASVHHLNAFVNQLMRLGEHHSPVYLDPETFEELLNS